LFGKADRSSGAVRSKPDSLPRIWRTSLPGSLPARDPATRPRNALPIAIQWLSGDVFCRQYEGAKHNGMSDRGFLFLFSLLMIAVGLGSAVWLFVSGQAGTVDGLFLVLTALLFAVVFGLYVLYAIRRALEAATPPPAQTAKAGVAAPAAKRTPTPAAQA
jgi:hypothetical protein